MLDNVEMLNKKEAILRSAYIIFTEKGYHGAKVSEIAKMANVGKGTVYEYFSSKEDLLRGVIKEGIKYYIEELNISINEVDHPWEKIKNMIRKHADILRENRNISELMFHHFGIMSEDFLQFLFKQRQVLIGTIQHLLEAAEEQDEIIPINKMIGARIILGTTMAIDGESDCIEKEQIEELLATLESGFLKSRK